MAIRFGGIVQTIRRLKADESYDVICARVGIQVSTIKAIRQAGTYEKYEARRKARAQKASSKRAIHPAPRPTQVPIIHVRTHKKHIPVNRITSVKKSVATPQAIHGVTEEPVSAYMLNEAYQEIKALETELRVKIDAAHERADEAVLLARKAHKSVSEYQRDDVRKFVAAKRHWWRAGR